jgi:hypothetical protein
VAQAVGGELFFRPYQHFAGALESAAVGRSCGACGKGRSHPRGFQLGAI